MSTLRSAVIRLAAREPSMRKDLLSILKTGGRALGLKFSVVPEQEISALEDRLVMHFREAVEDYRSSLSGEEGDPDVLERGPDEWSDLEEDMNDSRFPDWLANDAFGAMFPGGLRDGDTHTNVGWKGVPFSMRNFPKIREAYIYVVKHDPKVRALISAIHAAYLQ